MANSSAPPGMPFYIKNCSLASMAAGLQAGSLFELREKLAQIDESSIYYHFWGVKLNPHFVHAQYHNDFAVWAYYRLHDQILAEKLSVLDPTEFGSLEQLRQELIETVEERLDEYEFQLLTTKEDRFHFIRSMIIVFDSALTLNKPEELPEVLATLPPSSIFYHFIDARHRTAEKVDDFSVWLKMFDSEYASLIESIQSIDPFFLTLTELRDELTKTVQHFFRAAG